MIMLDLFSSFFLVILSFGFFFVFFSSRKNGEEESSSPCPPNYKTIPKSYPLIGMLPTLFANKERLCQWISDMLQATPSGTFAFHGILGQRHYVATADPSNVRHMLKTKLHKYIKADTVTSSGTDLLGNGIVNAEGDNWKFQRQVASHEFNKKSLRKFVETVVDTELSERLIPILSAAAAAATAANTTSSSSSSSSVVGVGGDVLDFQDILQRFGFDNICKIAFGYDPELLTPSLPQAGFAVAFEDSVRLTGERSFFLSPVIWKIKRFLSIGSEKDLKRSVSEVREFAKKVITAKKRELKKNTSPNNNEDSDEDLLSRFLSSGHSDEDFVTDIVINFLLAGRDTTSAVLTWFFWLVSRNPTVEEEIVKEIGGKSEQMSFDEVNDMAYTHASLFETMRLYPAVVVTSREVAEDDVWPDGTEVKKGMHVLFHIYAMGRSEKLWGSDWSEFRPERWLEIDDIDGKWRFVPKDPYTYPVFQAGPRICLGKDMAILQMKKVVAGVMRWFRVVPTLPKDGPDPVYLIYLTSKMEGGLPVRIEERKTILS